MDTEQWEDKDLYRLRGKKSYGSDLLPSLGKVLVFVPGLFLLLGRVALSQIAAELGKFNSSIEVQC